MKSEQKRLIERFKELYGNPTYKEMAEITDIQMTRAFRLCNGFEMKLTEYLKISKKIDEKIAETSTIKDTFNTCLNELSANALKEIEKFCVRKLEVKQILKSSIIKEVVA